MKTLAILVNKIVSALGRLFKRGSSLPGYLTLKLDKNILSKLSLGDKIVIVTGTNGKTSTTKYIAESLRASKYSVCSNESGANMPQGITTEILKHVNLKGQLKKDCLVLEVDEAYVETINRQIKADYLLVTNLFKDQVERFSDENLVKDIILKGIVKENTLILNADDPFTKHLGDLLDNPKVYFAYQKNAMEKQDVDEVKCPQCQSNLSYSKSVYSHLGWYTCTSCEFKHPEAIKYGVENYDASRESLTINGFDFNLNNIALYNTYNYLAAVSVLKEFNVSDSIISETLEKTSVNKGRMETFENNGHQSFVNLVKNEVGISQTFDYIKRLDEDEFNLFLSVHSRVPDGPNIDWLNNVNQGILDMSRVSQFIISGDEADRVSKLLIENGLDASKIQTINAIDKGIQEVLKDKTKPVYILANYTSLVEVRQSVFKN